ncbi:Alpha/Beta hydrolase protein [Suillus spraguei]|nr:Alpha/Beta hydrolase protein [Suillus spraguei]
MPIPPIPHIPDELQKGVSVVVETKYGPVKGGRTTNGASVFLEVPYALPPVRFQDPNPLPPDYRYENKDYIYETKYCVQPSNDGQGAATAPADRKGYGEPSEDPFLQFGSPHGLSSQSQYVAELRKEIHINIGYRLSVLGFLACDEPKIDGNFGFKDQWLALQWISENIASFGGDPSNVQLSGLSAALLTSTRCPFVHQILHHLSHLPPGQKSPTVPKTPLELRQSFQALCRTLNLDPNASDVLETLRDPAKVPIKAMMKVIETDEVGVEYGTYRGCLDGNWIPTTPDPMTWQRSGGLARALREKGRGVVPLRDRHPVQGPQDVFPNVLRYFPLSVVEKLVNMYRTLPSTATVEESMRLMGDILSDGQVHIPVRMFARDFQQAGFPILRYVIRWTPEQLRPKGWVTHGTDRCFWALRIPSMNYPQTKKAIEWLDAFDKEIAALEQQDKPMHELDEALTMQEDQSIVWAEDKRWAELMNIAKILPGES